MNISLHVGTSLLGVLATINHPETLSQDWDMLNSVRRTRQETVVLDSRSWGAGHTAKGFSMQ